MGIIIKSINTLTPKKKMIPKKAPLCLRICGHIYLNILENENMRQFYQKKPKKPMIRSLNILPLLNKERVGVR
jgi:hypothetical protein